MTEDCLGQANVPAVEIVPQGSEADVHSLADNLFKFAQDNFHNTVITQVTKESASNFRENSFPPSNLSFHLQSVETNFVSWKRTDPRVSKEVFKCKILPSAVSRCFSIQSTKSEASQSNRMIIPFSDILGLEVKEDSIVMDVGVLPKMEQRVTSSKTGARLVTHRRASGRRKLSVIKLIVNHLTEYVLKNSVSMTQAPFS